MSEGNGYATADQLFGSAFKRRYADHVQMFNGSSYKFRLQNLHDGEKGEFDADALNNKGRFKRSSVSTANARIVVMGCVDGDGQRIFSNADVSRIQGYDSAEVEKLAAAIRLHCGWEEAPEKNSDTTDDADLLTS